MNKRSSLSIILMLATFASVLGQRPTPTPSPSPAPPQSQQSATAEENDEVVRITSNLVQVDVVVTDSKGKQVTDLSADDFEVFEDNRPQKITNFSYISNETAPAQPVANNDKTMPPVPPTRLRPEQVRRTMALVVDDLNLTFESAHFVRRALRKFVDEQMQPGDLVAIIRTGSGMGILQQFTSDKRQLNAAIARVLFNPYGRAGISSFAPIGRNLDDAQANDPESESLGRSPGDMNEDMNRFREEIFTIGTLGALNYIIRGLKDLPGRKSVLVISEGFSIFNTPRSTTSDKLDNIGSNGRVLDSLRRLIDLANRASVVIYTMDPRGLPVLGFSAEDNISNLSPAQLMETLNARSAALFESQNGPNYLARETGGFSIFNTNDLSGGIRRVMDDQKGFYLIGYRPEESTFDPKTGSRRFYHLAVKVKRPRLTVRTRNGFYGVVNEEARAVPHTRVDQLVAALTSPFNSNGINLRLTSLYGNDPKGGAFVRSLLHIQGRDVTFTKEADGWSKAVLDVLVITFGDNGALVDQISKTYTLRVRGEVYERALRNGFTYTVNLPIKKGGAYQLRAALRDAASERVGSASQFIEIPDIKKNRLTLSGIVMSGVDPAAVNNNAPAARIPASTDLTVVQGTDQTADSTDPEANPAVRRFKRGMVLQYEYLIFNAPLDKATSRPQLETQVRIFRDGQPVFTGNPKPFDPSNQTDLKRLIAGGALRLGTDMMPGDYVLQIIVTDALSKNKSRTATQWMDFEIVK